MFPLQPVPLPESLLSGYLGPDTRPARGPRKLPPTRRHPRLVYDWLIAAAETISANATPCDFLVERLVAGATHRGLAAECRDWLNENRPGKAWSPAFPSYGFIDRFALRAMYGPGSPEQNRIDAAQEVGIALTNARAGPRLTAGRAAARAARKTATRIDTNAATSAITPAGQRGVMAATYTDEQ